MTTPIRRRSSPSGLTWLSAVSLLPALSASAQLTPDIINQLHEVVGSRIEAMAVLGGDYGVSGGSFNGDGNEISLLKFGQTGDKGDPRPLGLGDIKWQPRFFGNIGFLKNERDYKIGPLAGDSSEDKAWAIEFGGGGRFWFNEHFSLSPTIGGILGHTENEYTANSAFSQANFALARAAGLIDWDADTWSIRPGLDASYRWMYQNMTFEVTSSLSYFHTEDFDTSNRNVSVKGDSETWVNTFDVDVPLGKELWGHELHTGGFVSLSNFFGDLTDGLNTDYLVEVHGRLVLDFLGKLWKVKWLGVGASYLRGDEVEGFSIGLDAKFKF